MTLYWRESGRWWSLSASQLSPFTPPHTESASASHSLVYTSTAVSEAGLLSQLLISRVLDQQTVSHWDSTSQRETRTRHWPSGAAGLEDIDYELEETENRERLQGILRKRSNMGKDVLQRCRGCRLEDDGSVALFDHYGFNGKYFLSFEVDNMIWRASSLQAKDTQRDWNQNRVKNQYTRFFLEIDCMETLKRFLEFREIDKNHTGLCSAGDGTSQWHKIALASGITVLAACLLSMIGYGLNKRKQEEDQYANAGFVTARR
nr:PREDICTED: patr class I histocompatibility antigen, A-5 alpha chain-like [Lepisosteus oculatus]